MNLTVSEVAQALGISVSTFTNYLYQDKKGLRGTIIRSLIYKTVFETRNGRVTRTFRPEDVQALKDTLAEKFSAVCACGQIFVKKHRHQVTCSKICSEKHHLTVIKQWHKQNKKPKEVKPKKVKEIKPKKVKEIKPKKVKPTRQKHAILLSNIPVQPLPQVEWGTCKTEGCDGEPNVFTGLCSACQAKQRYKSGRYVRMKGI